MMLTGTGCNGVERQAGIPGDPMQSGVDGFCRAYGYSFFWQYLFHVPGIRPGGSYLDGLDGPTVSTEGFIASDRLLSLTWFHKCPTDCRHLRLASLQVSRVTPSEYGCSQTRWYSCASFASCHAPTESVLIHKAPLFSPPQTP
jgi:hypothetical protein